MANNEKSYISRQFVYTSGVSFLHPIEFRAFWPCNNGFLSPIVPGPNMPLPPPIPYAGGVPMQHHLYPPGMQPMMAANLLTADFRSGIRATPNRFYQRAEDERVANTATGFEEAPTVVNNEQTQNFYNVDSEHDLKEINSSSRASSTTDSDPLNNMPLGFSAARLAGDGSSNDSSPAMCNDSTFKKNDSDSTVFNADGTVTMSESKYNELTRLALNGSEIAEKLAYTHRNRPCFKKIDSLCARMKQDLIRPDGVLPNINSQGIAWAIKDLIFVFTRIISAWIIIKGYVFNTPEGLNKVKQSLCPDFVTRFLVWQDATYDFAESLVRSFVNLDNLAQSQKSSHQKSNDSFECNVASPTKSHGSGSANHFDDKYDIYERRMENLQVAADSNVNNNYLYTMVKDSENSQREATVNGTYFKTGTYRPITKETYRDDGNNNNSNAPNPTSKLNQLTQPPVLGNNLISNAAVAVAAASAAAAVASVNVNVSRELATPPDAQILEASEILNDYFNEELYQRLATGEIDIPMVEQYLREHLPTNWIDYGTRMFWRMFAERALQTPTSGSTTTPAVSTSFATTAYSFQQNMPNMLSLLLEGLLAIQTSDLFFKLHFAKNYFPKFIAKYQDKIIDLRGIIVKSEMDQYAHVFELVHDVRRIFFYAKIFLEFNVDPNLLKAINAFESEFDVLLRTKPFNVLRFDHIIGDPEEDLYLLSEYSLNTST